MEEQERTTIYTDKSTREKLMRLAEKDHRTLIDELRWIISEELARRELVLDVSQENK